MRIKSEGVTSIKCGPSIDDHVDAGGGGGMWRQMCGIDDGLRKLEKKICGDKNPLKYYLPTGIRISVALWTSSHDSE